MRQLALFLSFAAQLLTLFFLFFGYFCLLLSPSFASVCGLWPVISFFQLQIHFIRTVDSLSLSFQTLPIKRLLFIITGTFLPASFVFSFRLAPSAQIGVSFTRTTVHRLDQTAAASIS
jgi:hypothetical protein